MNQHTGIVIDNLISVALSGEPFCRFSARLRREFRPRFLLRASVTFPKEPRLLSRSDITLLQLADMKPWNVEFLCWTMKIGGISMR